MLLAEGLGPKHRAAEELPRLGRASWRPAAGQRPLSSRRHFPAAPQRGVSRPCCTFPGKAATAQPSPPPGSLPGGSDGPAARRP